MIRILLVEDQALVLGALAALLELEDDLQVVGRAGNAEKALELAAELRPDVVLDRHRDARPLRPRAGRRAAQPRPLPPR